MWKCKDCIFQTRRKSTLYKHYKLQHGHYGPSNPQPCLYNDCPCRFKTSAALQTHMSRYHLQDTDPLNVFKNPIAFKCHVCEKNDITTEKTFFEHLHKHLKNNETVVCAFHGCSFTTNVSGTFRSHKSRTHTPHTLADFKIKIVQHPGCHTDVGSQDTCFPRELHVEDVEEGEDLYAEDNSEDLHVNRSTQAIERTFAALLLKLENILHVSSKAVDELVTELEFIITSVSTLDIQGILEETLKKHNCNIDKAVIEELANSVNATNPIITAIGKDGPLATAYKRKEYYRKHFSVVQPVEYILNAKENITYQYVPILQSLQQVLNVNEILDKVLNIDESGQNEAVDDMPQYKSFRDGNFFKENRLLSGEEFQIFVGLYVDDFEVCNPLGTSKKKHKVCAVYWVLSDLPLKYRSSLTSINLAVLCKSVDVKKYGFSQVLEPLIKDLDTLETNGVFISKLGKHIKGTVQCVAADNLGAHSLAGFVESFSGHYVCRFCTGKHSDFQSKEVRSGAFQLRTKGEHSEHVKTSLEDEAMNNCYGVKRDCVLTKKLSNFHVLTGYPPDVLHDIFEGIVPVELARCLRVLISKNYFTLDELNDVIKHFPYKWADKRNSPQLIPDKFLTTIHGNAHENWALLRLLPFFVGTRIPHGEPAWEILMDLKDIVELVVAPVHTEESIAFLDCKISEHRQKFQVVFPDVKLIPKHHFIEHYPQLIRSWGPLVALWTMRYEAKHSFFKQVARYTNCFKNILLSLAVKHQFMLSHHFNSSWTTKTAIEVSNVSNVPLVVLRDDIKRVVKQKHPQLRTVPLSKRASYYGTNYVVGMILTTGSTAGLPDFVEIVHLIILQDNLSFVVRRLSAWYTEHLRSFELVSSVNELDVLDINELTDYYPLVSYTVGGKCMVTLKRYNPTS